MGSQDYRLKIQSVPKEETDGPRNLQGDLFQMSHPEILSLQTQQREPPLNASQISKLLQLCWFELGRDSARDDLGKLRRE
jgi:hypothetical protein